MTLLALAFLATAILIWPRGRPTVASVRWSSRGQPDSGAPAGIAARLRALLAREIRFGGRPRGWVADFAELSAVGLDAGLPAGEAARLACSVGGSASSGSELATLGRELEVVQDRGGSVGDCLSGAARGNRDLAFLAAAWQLTDEYGVPAAPAARTSATVLRERAASQDRRTVLAAGPRASMWLLTLLPLSGPLVAVVLGLPVGQVYGSAASLAATVGGLGLTALGWWWSRTVLRRALRPAEVS